MSATFQERLAEALQLRQMKQSELSRLSGVSRASINHYLTGLYEAKPEAAFKMSKALRVNIQWLMGLDVPLIENYDQLQAEEKLLDMVKTTYGADAKKLLEVYVQLSEADRPKALELLSSFFSIDEYQQGRVMERITMIKDAQILYEAKK